jgi:hypothetical protein
MKLFWDQILCKNTRGNVIENMIQRKEAGFSILLPPLHPNLLLNPNSRFLKRFSSSTVQGLPFGITQHLIKSKPKPKQTRQKTQPNQSFQIDQANIKHGPLTDAT